MVIAGWDAAIKQIGGREVDWCQHCGQLRYRGDMRWLFDLYGCRGCLAGGGAHEVWTPALPVTPWPKQADWVQTEKAWA